MFVSPVPATDNFAPDGCEPLRNFRIVVQYHQRSQNHVAGYAVKFINIATGEQRVAGFELSHEQAVCVASAIYDALWFRD